VLYLQDFEVVANLVYDQGRVSIRGNIMMSKRYADGRIAQSRAEYGDPFLLRGTEDGFIVVQPCAHVLEELPA
jgi:hypothetical protein